MGKVLTAWVTATSSVVAIGLTFVYPPAAVALSAVTMVATWTRIFALNVPAVRLAYLVALSTHATTIFLCTRAPFLAAAVLPLGLAHVPWELVMRSSRSLFDFQGLISLAIGAALVVAAWPVGWWGLAVVPNVGLCAMFAMRGISSRAAERGLTAKFKFAVGETMPEVRLPTRAATGEFDLGEERGHHVLLVFVRGDWCPVCHVMMRIISREADMLKAMQVKVALISPEEDAANDEFARHLKLQPGMLLDKGSRLARSLGIIESEKDGKPVPMPVSVLVDREGIVRNISRPDDVSSFATETRVLDILRAEPLAA